MITDKELIQAAIAAILRESDNALSLQADDFRRVCPAPAWAVHVVERSASKARATLAKAFSTEEVGTPEGIVVFIRSADLKMSELEKIESALPPSARFVKGMDFRRPSGGDIEIWVFG